MKEFEKNNVLSDDELDNVSGGTAGIGNLFPNNMGNISQPTVDNDLNWADRPALENPWVVIETGEGADGNGKYTYQISYNKTTGERRKERNYYWADPNFSG